MQSQETAGLKRSIKSKEAEARREHLAFTKAGVLFITLCTISGIILLKQMPPGPVFKWQEFAG